MPILPTSISLTLFLGDFVLIAAGAESERKGWRAKWSTIGFAVLLLGVLVVRDAMDGGSTESVVWLRR